MFKNLQETIKNLNSDIKNVTNCEKAKKLRKTLFRVGIPLTIIGFLGVFVCFILFLTGIDTLIKGFNTISANSLPTRILIPGILLIPCGIVGGTGSMLVSLGFKIVVAGYSTNLINEANGKNCPKCGATIDSEMMFCSKCGAQLNKECSNCKHINNHASSYCEKCGTNLQ